MQPIDVESFFKEIEEPYNYNASFVLEHYNELPLVFNHDECGLGTWDMVMDTSLITFALYSVQATLLLQKRFNLDRFLLVQKWDYEKALQEVRNGKKSSHWMWYIFPQMAGLGKSQMSQRFGIQGQWEALAYINHHVLRNRLVEITQAVLDNEKSPDEIFGGDAIKFRSCMILFATVSDIPVFKQACSKYNWIM